MKTHILRIDRMGHGVISLTPGQKKKGGKFGKNDTNPLVCLVSFKRNFFALSNWDKIIGPSF